MIPFCVEIDDGEPRFDSDSAEMKMVCCERNLCGFCGEEHHYYKYAILSVNAFYNAVSVFPLMHERCARRAVELCPQMASDDGVTVPETIVVTGSESYSLFQPASGPILFIYKKPQFVDVYEVVDGSFQRVGGRDLLLKKQSINSHHYYSGRKK